MARIKMDNNYDAKLKEDSIELKRLDKMCDKYTATKLSRTAMVRILINQEFERWTQSKKKA